MSDSKHDNNPFEGKDDFEKELEFYRNCEKVVHQKAKINLPVSIEPYVISGKIKTKCCGVPTVTIDPYCDCKDCCHYLITQKICIDIPLKFGAITETKDSFIECEEAYIDDESPCE